jgi:hypothetical protein
MTAARFKGQLVLAWERFWFQIVPPESYALLRISIGTLGLLGLLGLIPVSTFWTPEGLIPLPGGGSGLRAYVYSLGLGSSMGWAVFLALCLSFFCMAVGLFSGWAVAACFVGSILQAAWNRLPLSGVHDVMTALLFCLVWADTGKALSLDAWLARRRGSTHQRRSLVGETIWPLRLIRIQVALIYVNTGLWKLLGSQWRDGSALHYTLDLNTYQRFPFTLPANLDWIATLGTYVTLIWEIAFPVMLFHPWTRMLALGGGVLIHLGMFVTLEVGLFSLVMIASYLAFLDPFRVAGLVSRIAGYSTRTATTSTSRAATTV